MQLRDLQKNAMSRPSFAALARAYPTRQEYMREGLYDAMGWPDLKRHPAFKDTCAIRMSIALNGANEPVSGWLKIKAGQLAGRRVEPSQAALSRWLKGKWGQPEIFKTPDEARRKIGNRTGVVSFWGIGGTAQGHIDIVEPAAHGFHSCAMECYFQSREIWFWHVR